MESQSDAPLLKRTLLMFSAMVGACVVFVGTLCLVALLIVGKAVGPSSSSASSEGDVAPATNAKPAPGGMVPGGNGNKAPVTAANRKVM